MTYGKRILANGHLRSIPCLDSCNVQVDMLESHKTYFVSAGRVNSRPLRPWAGLKALLQGVCAYRPIRDRPCFLIIPSRQGMHTGHDSR